MSGKPGLPSESRCNGLDIDPNQFGDITPAHVAGETEPHGGISPPFTLLIGGFIGERPIQRLPAVINELFWRLFAHF